MKSRTVGILILMLASMCTTIYAQNGTQPAQTGKQHDDAMGYEDSNPPGLGSPVSEKKRDEIRKKVEAVRIWRLTEALKLDATTSAKLSSLLNSLDQQRQTIQLGQMKAMREMRLALKAPKPDEAKLKSLIEKSQNDFHAMQELREKEMSGLKDILTIEQQARFLIFQQEFQREMRGMITGVRRRGQGTEEGSANPPERKGP